MNENTDPFKDPNKELMETIERAVNQVEAMKDVFPSKALDRLSMYLHVIKNLYPQHFERFIISQCIEDGKLLVRDFELYLGGDTYFKITVEAKKQDKNKSPETTKKRKWYQI